VNISYNLKFLKADLQANRTASQFSCRKKTNSSPTNSMHKLKMMMMKHHSVMLLLRLWHSRTTP